MHELLGPLLLSLRVSIVATMVTALIAVPLAYLLAKRKFAGKRVVESLLTLPLVLPPTVTGYFLVWLLGMHGFLGQWLDRFLGVRLIFDWRGAVVAAAIVSFPLLLLPAKAAFASIDRDLEDVATLLGAGPIRQFWLVAIPLARRGLLSGTLLAFARSLGEFGATVMILGDIAGRQTLPISIYSDYASGQSLEWASPACWAVLALSGVSVAVIFIYGRLSE